ncbi:hypothetical protein NX786_22220 [Telluria mixta]|uniref:Amino acid permease/ SLC12A domain-containing protein n=1 Tax=Telluria mixta TaxID=34071 RepID=A0ABT2C3T1_9BURK|nr:hypothetical protein [Telluria mixta]MCS0632047.1 hypothetical protein [Telluria mixta]WEM95275.1 hypothetical protein P0M04_27960 [Telluria mixta]
MWIVAIGWMYVVTLMAATEPTVVGGIMTFFGYGVLPFSIVFYLAGSRRRRARAAQPALKTADGTPVVPVAGYVPGADAGAAGHGCDGGGCAGH